MFSVQARIWTIPNDLEPGEDSRTVHCLLLTERRYGEQNPEPEAAKQHHHGDDQRATHPLLQGLCSSTSRVRLGQQQKCLRTSELGAADYKQHRNSHREMYGSQRGRECSRQISLLFPGTPTQSTVKSVRCEKRQRVAKNHKERRIRNVHIVNTKWFCKNFKQIYYNSLYGPLDKYLSLIC